jgi:ribosomal protein S3
MKKAIRRDEVQLRHPGRLLRARAAAMARYEWYREGRCRCTPWGPIRLRLAEAKTTYGKIGRKVWGVPRLRFPKGGGPGMPQAR